MCVCEEVKHTDKAEHWHCQRHPRHLHHPCNTSLHLTPALPEGQATVFLAKNFSAVHPVFFRPVPAFTTVECVLLKIKVVGASYNSNHCRHLPSAWISFLSPLQKAPKPGHTHLHIKRSSTSWNFKGHQSNQDNQRQNIYLCGLLQSAEKPLCLQ